MMRTEIHNLLHQKGAGDSPNLPVQSVASLTEKCLVGHYDKARRIEDYFNFYEVIGEGGFSKVKRVIQKETGDTYAVKIVDESRLLKEELPRVILEIETLAALKHPCICQLYQVYYSETKIYMVLEYCYTDLFEFIVRLANPLPETRARGIFVQLLSAISYLHHNGIVHRDIKPENILVKGSLQIRLSDFGFAARVSRHEKPLLCTYCGSLAYGAPEVIAGIPYSGIKADTWSLGVNLYILLTNRHPFSATKPPLLRAQIMSGRFPISKIFGKRSLDLIGQLLQVNPQARPPLREVWRHPWIQNITMKEVKNLGYSSKILGDPSENSTGSPEVQFWCHTPTCRSEPVKLVKTYRRGSFRWLISSTWRSLSQIKNLICCSKI